MPLIKRLSNVNLLAEKARNSKNDEGNPSTFQGEIQLLRKCHNLNSFVSFERLLGSFTVGSLTNLLRIVVAFLLEDTAVTASYTFVVVNLLGSSLSLPVDYRPSILSQIKCKRTLSRAVDSCGKRSIFR